MASQPSKTADELTTAIRSLVDKALESQTREQIVARGREVAAAIAETAGTAAERASEIANDVWRESAPQRREAVKEAVRLRRDAFKWGRKAWLNQLRMRVQHSDYWQTGQNLWESKSGIITDPIDNHVPRRTERPKY